MWAFMGALAMTQAANVASGATGSQENNDQAVVRPWYTKSDRSHSCPVAEGKEVFCARGYHRQGTACVPNAVPPTPRPPSHD